MSKAEQYETREQWLAAAIERLRPYFSDAGRELPGNVKATCGWPSRAATSRKRKRIGECWSDKASAGGTFEIFISPAVADSREVFAILVHELIHAAVVLGGGDGLAPFSALARKLHLAGPWTATSPAEGFDGAYCHDLDALGAYPHSVLSGESSAEKKQRVRLIKVSCADGDCGAVFRLTAKWIEVAGERLCCPVCGGPAHAGDGAGEPGDE